MDFVSADGVVSTTIDGRRADFDTAVPGVEVDVLKHLLRYSGTTVHVYWSRSSTRAALLHVYDALAAAGLSAHPSKNDALLGWDEMHPCTALVPMDNSPEPATPWGISPSGDVITLGDSFDSLLETESDQYVNHVWIICKTLQFPVSYFDTVHLHVATELFQRCTGDSAQSGLPHVFVRSYRFKGAVAPLLVWYRIHEYQVTCMMQEFLHVRYQHIPSAAVWYWQLLPYHVNLDQLGKSFDDEDILPSLHKLLRFAAVPPRTIGDLDNERLLMRGQKQPHHMSSHYGSGRCALWLGADVFFYIQKEADEDGNELTNVRIPGSYQEIPPWVMHLLVEVSIGVDAFAIGINVNNYLQRLQATASRSTQLLRSINWAAVPLIWKPTFMVGCDTCVTVQQAAEAQSRLIKAIAPSWEDPETVSETIERLGRITGV